MLDAWRDAQSSQPKQLRCSHNPVIMYARELKPDEPLPELDQVTKERNMNTSKTIIAGRIQNLTIYNGMNDICEKRKNYEVYYMHEAYKEYL